MNRILCLLAVGAVGAGCAVTAAEPDPAVRVNTLLPADAILLGEQHDAPEHQRIHRDVIDALAARGALGAVALEMAPQGGSTSELPRDASESQVQAALRWSSGWPWAAYGPAVMAAVRAGVPVLGANLPRAEMRTAMAESQLDALLPGPALKAQQQAIRLGHCDMLPETQIVPMTRIQIARDRAMAQTLVSLAVPGKTVVLLAGGRHVDRQVGVPLHLPAGLRTKVVTLRAGAAPDDGRSVIDADATWTTPPVDHKDYCAGVRPPGATMQEPPAGTARPAPPN
ncbi:MAG TPA: ChaN family lipoprotein [Ramlibacter sp.]|nr:ChaN family lipoprotein [Ramlibacter sp.]